jgi:hypothetical protein
MKKQGTHTKASQYVELLPPEVGDVNIVTHMTITRKRLGKNIPEFTLSTIEGYPLLCIGPINMWL